MKNVALFLLACSPLLAKSNHYPPTRDWIAELRAGAFLPTSHPIHKMFCHGWIEGEAEFTYRFIDGLAVWGNAGYSYKNGRSKFLHDSHIQIIPVSAGLKYIFLSHKIRPYVGLGPCYTFLHIKGYSPLTREKPFWLCRQIRDLFPSSQTLGHRSLRRLLLPTCQLSKSKNR